MIAIGLIIILIMAFIGWEVAQRYIPSKEPADLAQVLGVSGEETAIFLNEETLCFGPPRERETGGHRDYQGRPDLSASEMG